jgi:hypothetical protein
MRGRFRESELVERPPHRAEIRFSSVPCCPLPASGAREAALLSIRSKRQRLRACGAAFRLPGERLCHGGRGRSNITGDVGEPGDVD